MENISKRNLFNKHISPAAKKAYIFVSPVTAIAGIFLGVGILGDFIFNSLENTEDVTAFFYDLGLLVSSLILPFISSIIGLSLGGVYGLTGGVISGILVSSGSIIGNIPGEIRGASGILGAVAVGIVSGFAGLLCKKARVRLNIKNRYRPLLIILVITIGIFGALILGSICNYLNTNLSYMLAGISSFSKILTVLLLGFMVATDIGGPLYLSAYLFGSASIMTFESYYMVAVICASTVGTLTMVIDNILDGKKNEERIYSSLLILPCLLGIPLGNIPFFLRYGFKGVLSSAIGGIVASVLSFVFNLEAMYSSGGLLSVIAGANLPDTLNLFVAIFSGTVISTFMLRILKGDIMLRKVPVKIITEEITA